MTTQQQQGSVLAQVIATERFAKTTANTVSTRSHAVLQNAEALSGERATYGPVAPGAVQLPPESRRVQVRAPAVLKEYGEAWARYVDVQATRDYGNCSPDARADVTAPDGTLLIEAAPIPFLLWLEKQLGVWRMFAEKLPALDPAEEWPRQKDGVWETDPFEEIHAQEEPRSMVTVEATEHHPAQTHIFTREVVLGMWTTVKYSGALQQGHIDRTLQRLDALTMAVKDAIYKANLARVEDRDPGRKLMDYLFGGTQTPHGAAKS